MRNILAVCILSLGLCGCPKGTQGLATASDAIAHALNDTQTAIILACQSNPPQIDTATCANINRDLVNVAQAGKTLDAAIRANEQTTTVAPKVNAFLDAFNQILNNDVAQIKNLNTKVAISTILTGAESAVSVIAASVGK